MSDEYQGGDSVTEVTSESWFSRMGQSFVGVLIGLALFVVAFPLLFWNEGRAVQTARALAEGRAAVVSVAPDAPLPANEGKLVYLHGPLAAGEQLLPAGAGVGALKLRREVEIYQWVEEKKSTTEKELGGSTKTTTTYEYKKTWASGLNETAKFHKPEGHQNPSAAPLKAAVQTARNATLGGFRLTGAVTDLLGAYQPIPAGALAALAQRDVRAPVTTDGEWGYAGDPKQPKVGDVRVSYQFVPLTDASVVARQSQGGLDAYVTHNGRELVIAEMGSVSADQLFKGEEKTNTIVTWLLRGGGFICMMVGLMLVMRPLAVLASVLPFLQGVFEAGAFIIAFPIALSLSLVTIAVAWITYRPWLAIPLLLVAAGALLWPILRKHVGGAPQPAAAGAGRRPPPMPPGR